MDRNIILLYYVMHDKTPIDIGVMCVTL